MAIARCHQVAGVFVSHRATRARGFELTCRPETFAPHFRGGSCLKDCLPPAGMSAILGHPQETPMLRKLPPAGYLLALICFLLPFVEVSCNGQKVAALTGTQLLTGSQVAGNGGMFSPPKQQMKPEKSVVLAFIAGLAGLIISVFNQRLTTIIAGACGIVAGGSLLALQQSILSGAPPQALGLIQIQYDPGYYCSVLLFFITAALLFYLAFFRQAVPTIAPAAPYPPTYASPPSGQSWPPPQPLPAARPRFCPSCGQSNDADARFCIKCGSPQS